MADNVTANSIPVATRSVTYSGDASQNAQVVGLVAFSGADDAKTAADMPGDAFHGLDTDVTRLPPAMVDTFGSLRVAQGLNDVEVNFHRDSPANLVTITTAGTPAGTANNTTVPGLMQMSTGTGTTGEVKAVSRDTVVYRAGGEIYCLVTAAWLDGGAAGCNQRIGLYDTNNGFFLGYEGTSFGIVQRSGASDAAQITKANFNVDTLVGGTGSRFTSGGTPTAIDLTKLNVFRIRFGWLGAAPIKFEVLSPDGEWVLFHVIRQPNLSASPSIQSTDLPITAHLVKTSGAGDVRMNTACWGAGVTYSSLDFVTSATLGTAANSASTWNTFGVATIRVRVGTSTTGTIIFEGTTDGTNWITHPTVFLMAAAGGADTLISAAVTPSSGDTYRMQSVGYRAIRARTASTLGAAVTLHWVFDTNVSMVNVTNVQPGTSATSLGKAEDSPHATGDVGVMSLGVRAAAPTERSAGPTDGDYEPFATNEKGAVWVSQTPSANGGATTMNASSSDGGTALTSTAQAIKASAGTLVGYYIYNPNTTAQFVQFYNTAQGSVTVGTTAPLFMLTIPPTAAANLWMPGGITFSTAMSWSATSTAGGNGAPTTALDAVCWYA